MIMKVLFMFRFDPRNSSMFSSIITDISLHNLALLFQFSLDELVVFVVAVDRISFNHRLDALTFLA